MPPPPGGKTLRGAVSAAAASASASQHLQARSERAHVHLCVPVCKCALSQAHAVQRAVPRSVTACCLCPCVGPSLWWCLEGPAELRSPRPRLVPAGQHLPGASAFCYFTFPTCQSHSTFGNSGNKVPYTPTLKEPPRFLSPPASD